MKHYHNKYIRHDTTRHNTCGGDGKVDSSPDAKLRWLLLLILWVLLLLLIRFVVAVVVSADSVVATVVVSVGVGVVGNIAWKGRFCHGG